MPVVTLSDGSTKQFNEPIRVIDVASAIGPGLAKAAIAARVNDQLVDVSYQIDTDVNLNILTIKDDMSLEILRHSTAHLLAQAVKQLFPRAQVTIGPVIEDGFYYDFAYERPFTPDDLRAIEKRMKEIAKSGLTIVPRSMTRDQAIALFEGLGEYYKVEIIKDIPENESLTAYEQGDFIDLCRGPHVPSTSFLKAFKLTKVAGAYWRGNSDNVMLQRIYGTAWQDKAALKDYLHRLEEAEKRDHRQLAKKMDLYHMQDEAPGMVFWHSSGWTIFTQIQNYIRHKLAEYDYQEINTPMMADMSLWERSGHAEKFGDEMFSITQDEKCYAIKPMNCPGHVQVYKQGIHSYRDLPLRFAEFGSCHRNEPSGALHGLMRVRGLTQDDAHVFCTHQQIGQEIDSLLDMVYEFYQDFGFDDVVVKLSTRPEKRIGSDEVWDQAEKALANALNSKGVSWEEQPGEGAFYGPKIEFTLYDCLKRPWQCGTVQLDFSMPERLGATYVDANGDKQTPVMLHRAIIGSFERFIGVLLEHYEGKLPVWLAPQQVIVMTITDSQHQFATDVVKKLKKNGFRAQTDLRNEKIGYKIREHTISRVPYMIILGDQELSDRMLTIRTLDSKKMLSMTVPDFIERLVQDLQLKRRAISE
ncbi:MAG: threonine--tRNA ligase [Coxiellaceae bacterium]|nr:threonine--tRNA ligase [Coxiellaceae bacterium]|tara:strand:+ start:9451 stop:11373 length:1923 start_codon:yes stop_codon:yes gene_type:complete